MVPLPYDYAHLDAAASQLSHILREAGIFHVFFGRYAAGLIGSNRVTNSALAHVLKNLKGSNEQDINVITERSARHTLNGISAFTWSRDDGCWKYSYRDVEVSISTAAPDCGPWHFPSPRTAGKHTIDPRDLPDLDIMHPSTLILTKLKAWYESEVSQNPSMYMRSRAHLMDIMTTLQWLSDEKLRINLAAYPGVPKTELLNLLGKLYRNHQQARPYLAQTLSFIEMRDVMHSSR
ncbi:unnamed protein product [Penicillium glandicola]